jgi:shikimate kinase
MKSKLVLTGFMATGKSAVGRRVAAALGREFIDTDHLIVTRTGKAIAQIFNDEGEASFRALERQIIQELADSPVPAVISTGGGSLVDEQNYSTLAEVATIVCLTARPAVIAGRVGGSSNVRPKLAEAQLPLEEAIVALMARRAAAYARIGLTVDTSDLTIDEVAGAVLKAVEA